MEYILMVIIMLRRFYILFVFMIIVPFQVHARNFSSSEVKSFVADLSQQVLDVVKNNPDSVENRQQAFEKIFADHGNVKNIARFVAGSAWKAASETDKKEYTDLYRRYMAFTYAARISSFRDQTVRVGRVISNNRNNHLVHTDIVMPSPSQPIHIVWQLVSVGDALKINDLRIENISMTLTQRSEFKSILSKRDNKLSTLTHVLDKRIKDFMAVEKIATSS